MLSNKKNIIFVLAGCFLGSCFWAAPGLSIAQNVGPGCGEVMDNGFTVQCKDWQKQVDYPSDICTYSVCASDPDCIQQPTDHWYFDDPIRRTRQKNDQEVTLPAGLAWNDAPGWHITDSSELWNCGPQGRKPVTSKLFGINSYIVEIDNTKGQLGELKSQGGIFSALVTHPYFNPTDGDLNINCFFNSDTDIRWRVRPCAGVDGSDCESEDRAQWWTFHTSPAPEPLTPKDPDWNGPNSATGVNFCQATLTWCSAVVPQPKAAYNQNEDHALSYQIAVHSNEAQAIGLANAIIPAQFTQYADWLKIDKLGYGPQETCHYMEKQIDGTCKAEVVNPVSGKEGRLFFSNYLNPNNDKDLFTKNIVYYWQPRTCFNNPNAGDDSCQKTNFIHYGQKWKFTTAPAAIAPPELSSPPDDQMSADQINASPIGLPATIAWKQPCGANSYGYQVQEVDGASYKDLFVGERQTVNTQTLFSSTASQMSGTDVEPIDLRLDTAYRWRLHSCWPSLPLRASDCENTWSPWFNFRTTGRPPQAESMQPANNSNQVTLPVTLQWERVPGALAYIVEVNGKNQIVIAKADTDPVVLQLTYPTVTQNKTYHWQIRTCADINAVNCGTGSDEMVFSTAALAAATAGQGQRPKSGEAIQAQNLPPTYVFSWDEVPGAQYYHFTMTYVDKSQKEKNKDCVTGKLVDTYVSRQNSYGVPHSIQGLYCLGNYTWNTQACMDQNCKDAGPVSPDWSFSLASDNAPNGSYGLSVCGQPFDNPGTPYDEREACQPKHFFLELQRVINFILFTLALWTLPFLGIATGIIAFTSLGGQGTKAMIKSWWQAIGIGYALLFFAWIITTWLLQIVGFHGLWYKIF